MSGDAEPAGIALGPVEIQEGCEGQTPRAPRHLAFLHYLTEAPRREAAIKPASRRTCDKFECWHEADMNGVWAPQPQETFIIHICEICLGESQQTLKRTNLRGRGWFTQTAGSPGHRRGANIGIPEIDNADRLCYPY